MTPPSVRTGHHPADAPWVRTRLRTAPGTAWALALLVLVTSFLAALFPRAVEHQGIEGLHHDITTADPGRSVLELSSPQPSLQMPPAEREAAVRGAALKTVHDKARGALPAEVRPGATDSAYGFRTSRPAPAPERWLARPEGIDPQLNYASVSDLPGHATLRSGSWPAARGPVTENTGEVEGVVSEETAKALGAVPGATVSV
ncbi:ABC transporter permease, partial [Streptomyces sp. NPDC089733]